MNTRFGYLESSLHAAIAAGHENQAIVFVDYLLKNAQPEIFAKEDENGRNFLQVALLAGMPRLTKKLLAIKFTYSRTDLFSNRDNDDATSFLLATNAYNTIELLQELAALCRTYPSSSPDHQMWLLPDKHGLTPLYQLVKLKRYHTVAWLIEFIAPELAQLYNELESLNPMSNERKILRARIEACEATLLPYINRLANDGTAFHAACAADPACVDLIALLINSGAELYNLRDTHGRSGFELLLSLPTNTLFDIFRRLRRSHQIYFLSQYEIALTANPAMDKTTFLKLNSLISLFRATHFSILQSPVLKLSYIEMAKHNMLKGAQTDLVGYPIPYEHPAMRQHHLFYQDMCELNKILEDLAIWIDDLTTRPEVSRCRSHGMWCISSAGGVTAAGSIGGFASSLKFRLIEDYDANFSLLTSLLFIGLIVMIIASMAGEKISMTRVPSSEWMTLINKINAIILMPLQAMEIENVDALPVPSEIVRDLERWLNVFPYRLIPPGLEVTRVAAAGLQTTLQRVKRDMVKCYRPFTFFPQLSVDEVIVELPHSEHSDQEQSSDNEMEPLLAANQSIRSGY